MGFEEIYVNDCFGYTPGIEEVLWLVKGKYELSPELDEIFVQEFVNFEQGRLCYVSITCTRIDNASFACRTEQVYPSIDEEANDDDDWFFFKDFSSNMKEDVYVLGTYDLSIEGADEWDYIFL